MSPLLCEASGIPDYDLCWQSLFRETSLNQDPAYQLATLVAKSLEFWASVFLSEWWGGHSILQLQIFCGSNGSLAVHG